MCVQIHVSICTTPKWFVIILKNMNSHMLCLHYSGTRTKGAYLYVGTDWLSLSVSQRVARGQLAEGVTDAVTSASCAIIWITQECA